MTLLEFLKALFNSEPLKEKEIQPKSYKENDASLDEEEEVVAMEMADEEEEFFM